MKYKMRRPPKFIVDIDETLLNPLNSWIKYVREKSGFDLSISEVEEFGGIQKLLIQKGMNERDIEELDKFRSDPELNKNLQPIPMAIEMLSETLALTNGKVSFYLTARPHSIRDVTISNLLDIGAPIAPVKFLNSTVTASVELKIEVIRELRLHSKGAIVVIDDNIDLISSLLKLAYNEVIPICVLGPFRKFQENTAEIEGISQYCLDWHEIPAYVFKLLRE
jgi:hypothetical protein